MARHKAERPAPQVVQWLEPLVAFMGWQGILAIGFGVAFVTMVLVLVIA